MPPGIPAADAHADCADGSRLLWRWAWRSALALALVLLGLQAALADPPARVGRVDWTEGRSTLQVPADEQNAAETVDSPRNWPVTTGSVIETGDNARAQISVGSTRIRIGSDARLEVTRLDDEALLLRVSDGSIALWVRNRSALRGVEVDAGSSQMFPLGPGMFRIDADGDTVGTTAWQSDLRVDSPASTVTLHSGQRGEFDADGGWYRLTTPESDRFARWAMTERDRRTTEERWVSPEMTGVDDLAGNGDWYDNADYGWIWVPRVVIAGWAPYRYGHWGWVSPWGWTWIDSAPWGFAPFHYGRWVMWGGRWAWVPGAYVAQPVYAPALVGWIGSPGISISVGVNVGWFPLAPREIYVPYYDCSPRYVQVVNYSHVPRIEHAEIYVGGRTRVIPPPVQYRYADAAYAHSVLPSDAFRQHGWTPQPTPRPAGAWPHGAPQVATPPPAPTWVGPLSNRAPLRPAPKPGPQVMRPQPEPVPVPGRSPGPVPGPVPGPEPRRIPQAQPFQVIPPPVQPPRVVPPRMAPPQVAPSQVPPAQVLRPSPAPGREPPHVVEPRPQPHERAPLRVEPKEAPQERGERRSPAN